MKHCRHVYNQPLPVPAIRFKSTLVFLAALKLSFVWNRELILVRLEIHMSVSFAAVFATTNKVATPCKKQQHTTH